MYICATSSCRLLTRSARGAEKRTLPVPLWWALSPERLWPGIRLRKSARSAQAPPTCGPEAMIGSLERQSEPGALRGAGGGTQPRPYCLNRAWEAICALPEEPFPWSPLVWSRGDLRCPGSPQFPTHLLTAAAGPVKGAGGGFLVALAGSRCHCMKRQPRP